MGSLDIGKYNKRNNVGHFLCKCHASCHVNGNNVVCLFIKFHQRLDTLVEIIEGRREAEKNCVKALFNFAFQR